MSLIGNLRNLNITQLINLINLAHRTGTLTIQGEEQASISFRKGEVIYASMEPAGSDLVEILRQSGKITNAQMRTIKSNTRGMSEKQIGRLLIQTGFFKRIEIIEKVRQHVVGIICEIVTWPEGTFHFHEGQLPPVDKIIVSTDIKNVIGQADLYLQEWMLLQEELPNLDICLRCPPQPTNRLYDIRLNLKEWQVVTSSNARNTIRQIAKANRLSMFQIRRIVYGLLQVGLVEITAFPQAIPSTF